MTGYFSTVELNSALSSLSTKLTEKASVASLYPVLKKATASCEDPTPGYVFQVRGNNLPLSTRPSHSCIRSSSSSALIISITVATW